MDMLRRLISCRIIIIIYYRWLPAASTLVVVGQARCSSHRTRDHRWPCIQFNCSSNMEQFTKGSAVFWVTGHFSTPPENWTVFERSYNWHCACQTTLLLRDSLSLSHSFLLWLQPWSLSTIMLLWHSFLIIIIIIITWSRIIVSPLLKPCYSYLLHSYSWDRKV